MGLEPTHGGRNKKLIWALEASELLGRPSCSDCSARLRRKRGCKKPGHEGLEGAGEEAQQAWRFSSPWLDQSDSESLILRECPVGYTMREHPWLYDAISLASHIETGAFDPTNVSVYFKSAGRVILAERARLRDEMERKRQTERDSKYASKRLGG